MLRIGRHINSIMNGDILTALLVNTSPLLLFKYTKTPPIIEKLFTTISSGNCEIGCDTPNVNANWFVKRPARMRKATLNPTERIADSRKSKLSSFKSLKIIKPGTKVRQRKPITCLATGILKSTTTSKVNKRKTMIIKKHLEFNLRADNSIRMSSINRSSN